MSSLFVTKIEYGEGANKVVIPLRFGTWIIGQLKAQGIELDALKDLFSSDPLQGIEFAVTLLHLAACNAGNKDLNEFSRGKFYDHIDELGGFSSDKVISLLNMFATSLSSGVPVAKDAATKGGKSKPAMPAK